MNKQFTILSFASELILMHAKGNRMTLEEVDILSGSSDLLDRLEEIGFNNYEFIDAESKEEHFQILTTIIPELVLSETNALTSGTAKDCGLLYIAMALLNTAFSN